MPGTNAAQRVVNYLARIQMSAPNTPMVEALGTFFDYTPTEPYRDHARRLELMLSQIDIAVDGLCALKFPEHLYVPQVQSARNAFTVSALNQSWSHVIHQITPDVKLAFDWMAFALPDQNDALDKEALASLLDVLNAVSNDPLLQTLPTVWKELIQRHIQAILDALSAQPITGSTPIEKAVKDFATDLVVHADDLAEVSVAKEAAPFLKKAFRAVKTTIDLTVKSEKTIASIEKLYKLVSEKGPLLLELLHKM